MLLRNYSNDEEATTNILKIIESVHEIEDAESLVAFACDAIVSIVASYHNSLDYFIASDCASLFKTVLETNLKNASSIAWIAFIEEHDQHRCTCNCSED